jgi:hypothetical protein
LNLVGESEQGAAGATRQHREEKKSEMWQGRGGWGEKYKQEDEEARRETEKGPRHKERHRKSQELEEIYAQVRRDADRTQRKVRQSEMGTYASNKRASERERETETQSQREGGGGDEEIETERRKDGDGESVIEIERQRARAIERQRDGRTERRRNDREIER